MSYAVVCFALLLNASEPARLQADLDAKQTAAVREIERAARDFRIQVYETYRTNRAEYNARRFLADELLEAWIAAGRPAAYHADVLHWYADAAELATNVAAPLPPLPELPDPLPEAFAGDSDAPQLPVRPAAERKSFEHHGDYFSPKSVSPPPQPYDGPRFTPTSKILRSIQKALLSSTGVDPDSFDEPAAPTVDYPFSAGNVNSPFDN